VPAPRESSPGTALRLDRTCKPSKLTEAQTKSNSSEKEIRKKCHLKMQAEKGNQFVIRREPVIQATGTYLQMIHGPFFQMGMVMHRRGIFSAKCVIFGPPLQRDSWKSSFQSLPGLSYQLGLGKLFACLCGEWNFR